MPSGLISIIVPTYNVATYLPAFLASLQQQTLPLAEIEMLFVNDGSTDNSGSLIRAWTSEHAPHATIITKENGGLASARNAGLDAATGQWVNFCDPDDMFNPEYFQIVRDFLTSERAEKAHLVATNLQILDDETGEITDTHPLRFKFKRGDQLVDLERFPRWIHLQAASAFYRRAEIDRLGLRFDDDIRPNFEDAFLTTLYLIGFDRPTLAVLPDARYLYRRRADGTSLVQSSWLKPEKYTVLPRVGYLRLLQLVHERRGSVPEWAQNLVLYDLFFYFRADVRTHSDTAGLPSEVTDVFHDLVDQIVGYIDADVIDRYDVAWTTREMRMAMLYGAKKERDRPDCVTLTQLDPDQQLVELRYYFTGEPPAEAIKVTGHPVTAAHSKIRAVNFLNRTMVYERIAWVPAAGTVSVKIDGKSVPVRANASLDRQYSVKGSQMWKTLAGRTAPFDNPTMREPGRVGRKVAVLRETAQRYAKRVREHPELVGERSTDMVIRAQATAKTAKAKYDKAWLLIDRDSQAQDNAEHLYRYLREHEPNVNAWFVLARTSSDWDRLHREGFRLIEYGSRDYYVALSYCRHVISSQIDHYIVAPTDKRRLKKPRWRYTFLQHGVTKDDLSRWINSKPIDLMITVTPDEQESIAGDYSPYLFTTREIQMTGFPRHDRLHALAQQHDADRRLLLIMPTWRRELLGDTTAGGNDRELVASFWESTYAVQWRSLIESPQLHQIADEAGWRIVFIPHPNMQDYLDTSPLPDHIEVHRFRDIDIQDVVARGAMMVTDYSSMAFEMAYIQRPVVYFQFDQEAFFAGGHAYRKGTWSYEDNGFGPVTVDLAGALDAIAGIAGRGGAADGEYATRIEKTFPFRDGRCCKRTTDAIKRIRRRNAAVSVDSLRT